MGIHDRDWYRDELKTQHRAKRAPAAPRVFDRVGPRPGRPVEVRAKPWRRWMPSSSTPAWKIFLFWLVVVAGLTVYFQPIAAERAAKRLIQPALQLLCSAGAKCT